MYSELLYLIVVLGVLILLTYVEAFRSEHVSNLWGGLPKKPWVFSTILTVISFLYLSINWVFIMDDEQLFDKPFIEYRHYVLLQYILFLSGAVLWSFSTLLALQRQRKMLFVLFVLWMTALGSIGIFVMTCGLEDQILMQICGTIMMLHHVIFDALWWWITFNVNPPQVNSANTSRRTPTVTDYNNLQYI